MLHRKTKGRIRSKTAIFNLSIQGVKKDFPGWKTAEKQNSTFGKFSHFGTVHRNCVSEFWQCSWKEGFRILPRWKERKIFFLVGKKNETAREYPHFLRFHPFDYLSLKRGISQIGFIQGYTMMSEMR